MIKGQVVAHLVNGDVITGEVCELNEEGLEAFKEMKDHCMCIFREGRQGVLQVILEGKGTSIVFSLSNCLFVEFNLEGAEWDD